MKVTRIPARDLDSTLQARWREITDTHAEFASPYFCWDYTRLVADVRNDVFVGVLEADGRVQGFFPFQAKGRRVAGPVGGQLSDWHGVIAQRSLAWDIDAILRGCGVHIWDFDHVPAAQQAFAPHVTSRAASPVLDLSRGYQGYLEERKAAGAQRISQFQRKARKFEREVGPLRFEADSRDPRAFTQMVQGKREQCQRTGVPDFFAWGWTRAMVERIAAVDTPSFGGRLSVLWHEDNILGVHFGMRSARVWHWWFPTYNHGFSDYSPGGILLLKVAEAAAAGGASLLDLGKGDDVYKQSFATGELPLVEGSVLVPSWAALQRRVRKAGGRLLNGTPGLRQAWAAAKVLRDRVQRQDTAGTAASSRG